MKIKYNFEMPFWEENENFDSFQELLDFLKKRWNITLEFECDLMLSLKGKNIGEILALLDENKESIGYELYRIFNLSNT